MQRSQRWRRARAAGSTKIKRSDHTYLDDGPAADGGLLSFECDGYDVWISYNGRRIAKHVPDAAPAHMKWITLEPGWHVVSSEDYEHTDISYSPVRL
jgi:hypothetical protein